MAAHPSILVAEGLALRLPDDRTLFHSLTLGFDRGRTAVVGPNGAGKSALLDLLRGTRAPTEGRVRRQGRIAFLPQQVAAPPPDATVADLLGIESELAALERLEAGRGLPADLDRVAHRWDLRERAAHALVRAGLPTLTGSGFRREASSLSGGERTRVRLAALLLQEPDLLLLDEPTNHLDAPGRGAILDLVEAWGGGLVVATHDRVLLRRVDRILELGPPVPRLVTGSLEAWEAVRDREADAARKAHDHARRELRRARTEARAAQERQERRNARGRRDARRSNEPRILLGARRETSERTTARTADRSRRQEEEARLRLGEARERHRETARIAVAPAPTGLRSDQELLRLEAVVPCAPDSTPLSGPISARWAGPARVAITGPNGSGKSTLLRLLAGDAPPDRGRIVRGRAARAPALLRQDRPPPAPGAIETATVLSRFREAHPDLPEARAREWLAGLLFPGEAVHRAEAVLSGGERLRLELAVLLGGTCPPALLLLDEPTNHLDLPGIEALERILTGYDGAIIAVSHDRDFLSAIGVEEEVVLGP